MEGSHRVIQIFKQSSARVMGEIFARFGKFLRQTKAGSHNNNDTKTPVYIAPHICDGEKFAQAR